MKVASIELGHWINETKIMAMNETLTQASDTNDTDNNLRKGK